MQLIHFIYKNCAGVVICKAYRGTRSKVWRAQQWHIYWKYGYDKHWNCALDKTFNSLTNKIKCSFFQAAVMLILLYGCTTWTLTKRLEEKLDSNYTRMLQAILNKSWQQHPTKHQLYGHLPPITKTIQVRRTREAGRSS